MAKTLDKKIQCVKCGFRPTYQKEWKLEYKSKCNNYSYSSDCDWDDEVDEHIHMECPDCGYTIAVACEDHASATPDKWTTAKNVKPLASGMGAMNSQAQALVAQNKPVTVYTPPAPVVHPHCRTCPMDKKDE